MAHGRQVFIRFFATLLHPFCPVPNYTLVFVIVLTL